TALLWDVATGKQLGRLEGHSGGAPGFAANPRGRPPGMRPLEEDSGDVLGVALSADGKLAWTAGRDRSVQVWDCATGRAVRSFRIGPMEHARFAPDARSLVTSSKSGLRVWNTADGELRSYEPSVREVSSIDFSTDGRRFLTCHRDALTEVWDARTGRLTGS